MYVNYSTEGSAALLDHANLRLLVWVLCFVLLLFFLFWWLVFCRDGTGASLTVLYYRIVFLIN